MNDLIEFEPYGVFTRIDRKQQSFLDSTSIINFLKDNGKDLTELDLFIEYYDRDFDGVLNLEEYLTFIFPQHYFIRTVSAQKKTYKIPTDEYLTDELENILADIILNEASLFNHINQVKLEMFNQKTPDLISMFLILDSDRDGEISFTDLDVFCRKRGLVLFEEQINSLISVYDEDLNKSWNWNEFLFMILPSKMTYEYNIDYLRDLEVQYERIYGVKCNNNYHYDYDEVGVTVNPEKTKNHHRSGSGNYNESCEVTRDTIFFRDSFINDIYYLIQNEKKIEDIKMKLAYDPSFTLKGLFKHFDTKTSDCISQSAFIKGLEEFNVFDYNRVRLIFENYKVNKLK
jgi:Ca2+-binding EF-hand superfamily protein